MPPPNKDPAQEAYIQQQLEALRRESHDPRGRFANSPEFAPLHEARSGSIGRVFERAVGDAAIGGGAGALAGLALGGPVGAAGMGITGALTTGAVGGALQAWREFGPEGLQIPEEAEPFIGAAFGVPAAGAAKLATQMGRAAPSVARWMWQNRALGVPLGLGVASPLAWAVANREMMPNVGHAGAAIAGTVLGLTGIGISALRNPSNLRALPLVTGLPSAAGVIDKYMEPIQTPVRNALGLEPNTKAGRTRLEIDQSPPPPLKMDPNTGQPFGRPIPLD